VSCKVSKTFDEAEISKEDHEQGRFTQLHYVIDENANAGSLKVCTVKSNKYGFVSFATKEEAQNVIDSITKLKGEMVAEPFMKEVKVKKGNNLFVKNIPTTMTVKGLKSHFSNATRGEDITSCVIMPKEDNDKSGTNMLLLHLQYL
jgi:RNA recognition motif-containing protein